MKNEPRVLARLNAQPQRDSKCNIAVLPDPTRY
jgi:hypothetical protein